MLLKYPLSGMLYSMHTSCRAPRRPSWPCVLWTDNGSPSVQCAVCSVQCAVCSGAVVQCAVCSVQCAVCSVQCIQYTVCGAVSIVLYCVLNLPDSEAGEGAGVAPFHLLHSSVAGRNSCRHLHRIHVASQSNIFSGWLYCLLTTLPLNKLC